MPRVVTILSDEGNVVCRRCELADSVLRRLRGLLGRDGLPEGQGLLLEPAPSVHTFFMRFAIDVVFLDKSRTVLKVVHQLRPFRATSARKAAAALELHEGAAAAAGIREGMQLVVAEPVDRVTP